MEERVRMHNIYIYNEQTSIIAQPEDGPSSEKCIIIIITVIDYYINKEY